MSRSRKMALGIALAVLVATSTGSLLTRGVMDNLPFLRANGAFVAKGIVDQRPWQTASTLAALATSAEEKEFAREAERLADHEVDQNFSQSLRQASLNRPKPSEKAKALQQRMNELQATVKADQAQVAKLASAGEAAENDLELAKAQLGLDQSELDDTADDLTRETDEHRLKIQQELNARQAEMKKYNDAAAKGEQESAVASVGGRRTLARRINSWFANRSRQQLLQQALKLASDDAAALAGDHVRLKAEYEQPQAENLPRLEAIQNKSTQQSVLMILADRLATQKQLVGLYQKWSRQVEIQRQILVHRMLESLAIIAAIILLTILAGWGLQVALDRTLRDMRQKNTLKTILNLGTQCVGFILVLLVIFGVPEQTPTILGLATAGLTVVFQDFILAFCGWFVLMGPNGIRVHDWVEIDGVGGEVVELGIFRTWLLETGNWTANGHPTGRRVSFLNGFAIKGKYFNFSTAGQWMWDEIKLTVPVGADIHRLVEKIYAEAVRVTEADAKMAETEWKRVTREEGAPQFSAMPQVNLRPAGAGVDLVVRYITRASVRLEKRNKLFEKVLEALQEAKQ
ncbi:mechanosensitive ion channel domain-containing protein [Terriglobus tenax]|uniref:mechanosensitive ion channel domain-containing protein n=1 Tax=Terriglobus tenax TaxID=1111115 RepID=UPI0021DFA7B9|nr:mechanosensitive ion channel domain-containing protein [Terriglobus tenax]